MQQKSDEIKTFCAECGPNVSFDEDGCCMSCGSLCIGGGVKFIEDLRVQVEELREKMADKILMPTALTAENGAKNIFNGEFKIDVKMTCSACYFDGPQSECEVCGGSVEYTEKRTIEWTTIKEIYAMAVERLGETT